LAACAGRACSECRIGAGRGNKSGCVNEPTPDQPLEIECTECGGEGCSACDHGRWTITGCPWREIDLATVQAIGAARDRHRHGLLPIVGGTMDQTQSFADVCGIVLGEDARLRASEQIMAEQR